MKDCDWFAYFKTKTGHHCNCNLDC